MPHKVDRRTFLETSLAAAAVSALTPVCLGAEPAAKVADPKRPLLPIVDTHQHLWDLDKFRLPWLTADSKLKKSFVTADYLKATADLNVVKSVYMEVDVDPAQQQAEAEYVIEICKAKSSPMVAAVISGRPASDGFAAYIGQFKDSPYIKGVRQVLHGDQTKAGYCLDKAFIQGVRKLGELGMSFDLCMRKTELLDGAKLADECPDTRFILDHCGNGDPNELDLGLLHWKKSMAEVAQRKNVVCKVSGIVARAKPEKWTAADLAPLIHHTCEVFGPDRVMFGGDWPVCTLAATFRQWVEALKQVIQDRSEADQRKLLHDNAVRFYGLK